MILQNMVFPPDEAGENEIYVRYSARPGRTVRPYCIRQGEAVSTDTYMNAFDIGAWRKYTDISDLSLVWRIRGKGRLRIFWERENGENICLSEEAVAGQDSEPGKGKYHFQDFQQQTEGILYFRFYAETDSNIEAWYETDSPVRKGIKISVVICTYKRKEQLEQLINVLRKGIQASCGNKEDWLRIVVVDNASELEDQYGEGITVYHNPNTGGSGGFARGMKETVRNLPVFQASHVVLMDDDVVLQIESIIRLHALLSCVRPEYEQEVIAGRMFRLDRPHIQYTAAEIWNRGDIRHIGWNRDMTDRQRLWDMNENTGGEYSGWWFACFPTGFVKENEPLPFFLHCDDVEYGLRHGGTPIILNGIQVWHETYEYRQTPVIAYYDRRNSMIVNEIFGFTEWNQTQALDQFMSMLDELEAQGNYLLEYYMIRAFRDFLRGQKWFMNQDGRKLHDSLKKGMKASQFYNVINRKILKISVLWKRGRKLYFMDR